MTNLPSINDLIQQTVPTLAEGQRQNLTRVLMEREDIMADMLRMAGMQFGVYPQIVAEVFAEIGIGTPVEDGQRQLIRHQFVSLMEELQRQQGGGEGAGT